MALPPAEIERGELTLDEDPDPPKYFLPAEKIRPVIAGLEDVSCGAHSSDASQHRGDAGSWTL